MTKKPHGSHPQNPAHDSLLVINGDMIRVHRSYALARRIEEEFGALTSLVSNIRVNNVKVDQLLWLTQTMLKDGDNPKLNDEELMKWIEDEGPADVTEQVGQIILCLFMGNKKAEKFLAAKDDELEAEEEEGDPLLQAS